MGNEFHYTKSRQLLELNAGDLITKRNLYDLIQYSKIKNSKYWDGEDNMIHNTPQQGINWISDLPTAIAAIIKKRENGTYQNDGWIDKDKSIYRYSLKARKGIINYHEKANAVLINQPAFLYPIILLSEIGDSWMFEGYFKIKNVNENSVLLVFYDKNVINIYERGILDEIIYKEGSIKYIAHLIRERNRNIVNLVKARRSWNCDICNEDYLEKYGEKYIEAHHITPITKYTDEYEIKEQDFVLLCPNCHKATHIYIKKYDLDYSSIKKMILAILKK